jgi:hypothetical protein
MRYFILFFLWIGLGFLACGMNESKEGAGGGSVEKPEKSVSRDSNIKVLVELFTSEGCSSCPPADINLIKLEEGQPIKGVEIITLAFHVDYWDYLGWKDKFSSAEFSRRQNTYSTNFDLPSNYTPQMVVDGKYEFVGSRWTEALSGIKKAANDNKGEISIDLKKNETTAKINVKAAKISSDADSEILLAIAEDDLETMVKSGENGGKKLKHSAVVRNLIKLGEIKSREDSFKIEKDIPLNSDWKSKHLSFVVFVQNKSSKQVLAVGRVE